jgi:hypothetical protein
VAVPAETPANAPEAPALQARPKARAGAVDLEEFKNDPLIQKALEIFRGTIVEARI